MGNQIYIYPVSHNFKVGDRVVNRTSEAHNKAALPGQRRWPDVKGEIVEIDGSNIKVKYHSGNERWKIHINLRKRD